MCMPGFWPIGIRQSMWNGFSSTKVELSIAQYLPSLCASNLKISQVYSMRQDMICNCKAQPAYQILLNESLQKMSVMWISLLYIYMGAAYTTSPCKQNNAMSICSLSEQQLWPKSFAHVATYYCLPVLYSNVKFLQTMYSITGCSVLSRLISILSSYKPNVLKIWTSLFFACRQYRSSAYRVQNVVLCHEQRVVHQAEQCQEKLHWITCTWTNTIDANFVSFAKGEALHVILMDTSIRFDAVSRWRLTIHQAKIQGVPD